MMKETSYRLIVLSKLETALLRLYVATFHRQICATGRRVTGGIANAQAWFSLPISNYSADNVITGTGQ